MTTKDENYLAYKALGDVIKKRIDAMPVLPAIEKRIDVNVEAPILNIAAPVVNIDVPTPIVKIDPPSVELTLDMSSTVKSLNAMTKASAEYAKSSSDAFGEMREEMKIAVASLTEAVGTLTGSMALAMGSILEELVNIRNAMKAAPREKRTLTIKHDDGTSSTMVEE